MKPFIQLYNHSNRSGQIVRISEIIQYKLPILDKESEEQVKEVLSASNINFEEFISNKNYFYEKVNYSLNSYGYRTHNDLPEKYILACGCSHTYGTGLHQEERYTNLIEKEIGTPVINIGIPGSGVNFLLLNILRLINSDCPKPNAIICQFPNFERLSLPQIPGDPHRIHNQLRQILPTDKRFEELFYDDSIRIHSEMCYDLIISTLKNNKIKLIDFNYFYNFVTHKINLVDYARDCAHPGPRTNVNVKNYILEKL